MKKILIKLFENKDYFAIINLLIITTSLLILFIFANIAENPNKMLIDNNLNQKIQKQSPLTGFAVSEQNITNNQTLETEQQELYSNKSYIIFYLMIIALVAGISILTIILSIPKIKRYT